MRDTYGANRLVATDNTGFTTRSEFTYDGLNRVAKIVEKTGGTINSTRKVVWHGQEKLEFRDATDAVTQRNYSQGQYVGTTAYFYLRDHLGSIREMFTGGGTVVARYDYDPYGRSTTVLGTTPTDINFTGLYRHSKSNLDLATYRAYDPDLGRWLNRDPLQKAEIRQGPNLYAYVGNGPTNSTDRLGLYYLLNPATWGIGSYEGVSGGWENYSFWDFSDAAQATLDGIIPFADPFSDNGGYDKCDPLLQFSRDAGALARDIYTGRLLAGGLARLGGTPWGNSVLNSNRYLRIGPGRMPANGRFPASPNAPRISIGQGPGNPHIDLRP